MKKKAFTLVEIVFCMILISFLYLIVLYNIKTEHFNEKAFIATADKTIGSFNEASLKLMDSDNCPSGVLIDNIADGNELAIIDNKGSIPDAQGIIDIYSNYLKFTKTNIDFCNYTTYCDSADLKDIEGAKLVGNVVIGIEVFDKIQTCPDYYTIDTKEQVKGKDKCWGKLYIDVNADTGPDTLNKDVFVFGLDEQGVNK